jgi:hypothetical protein
MYYCFTPLFKSCFKYQCYIVFTRHHYRSYLDYLRQFCINYIMFLRTSVCVQLLNNTIKVKNLNAIHLNS